MMKLVIQEMNTPSYELIFSKFWMKQLMMISFQYMEHMVYANIIILISCCQYY